MGGQSLGWIQEDDPLGPSWYWDLMVVLGAGPRPPSQGPVPSDTRHHTETNSVKYVCVCFISTQTKVTRMLPRAALALLA